MFSFRILSHMKASFRGLVFSLALLVAYPAISAVAAPLTKDQISQEIIGKPLDAKRMGMPVRILYKKDGTVTMKFAILSGGGTWAYSSNGICMNLTSGPRRGETCVTFEHLKGNIYRNSEGINFTVAK